MPICAGNAVARVEIGIGANEAVCTGTAAIWTAPEIGANEADMTAQQPTFGKRTIRSCTFGNRRGETYKTDEGRCSPPVSGDGRDDVPTGNDDQQ